MDLFNEYLTRSKEIIGERTPDEERYDREVLHWLQAGKPIEFAVTKANQTFPGEALAMDDDSMGAIASHYDYLKSHEQIMDQLNQSGRAL